MPFWDGCSLMHMRYFCSAVRLGSLSASAREWRVGQSAISQAIRKLEEMSGGSLLNHYHGRFEPTALGLIFYEHACRVIETFESMKRAIESSQASRKSVLSIGCSHSVALSLIATALAQKASEVLGFEISLQIGAPDLVRQWLQQGLIDCAIVVEEPQDCSWISCLIHEGTFALFQVSELAAEYERCLLVSQQSRESDWLREQLKGFQDLEWMFVRSWEVLADLAHKGLGIAFLPDYLALFPERSLQICSRFSLPVFPYRLLTLSRQQPLDPSVKRLSQWLGLLLSNRVNTLGQKS